MLFNKFDRVVLACWISFSEAECGADILKKEDGYQGVLGGGVDKTERSGDHNRRSTYRWVRK